MPHCASLHRSRHARNNIELKTLVLLAMPSASTLISNIILSKRTQIQPGSVCLSSFSNCLRWARKKYVFHREIYVVRAGMYGSPICSATKRKKTKTVGKTTLTWIVNSPYFIHNQAIRKEMRLKIPRIKFSFSFYCLRRQYDAANIEQKQNSLQFSHWHLHISASPKCHCHRNIDLVGLWVPNWRY